MAGLLVGCGEEVAPTALPTSVAPLVIPTFTSAPAIQLDGTPTPTPIVVPPTERPTDTPVPTNTPTIAPTVTPTPRPTDTPVPTPTRPAGALQDITVEQARNFNGYHALLPAYLPTDFKLTRLSGGHAQGSDIILILAEYQDAAGNVFYFNTQALPGVTAAPIVTSTPFPTFASLSPGATALPTSTPLPTFTPRPTASGSQFGQETVEVRGQLALLSYNNAQSSLSWSEGPTQYLLNGTLSKEEIVKVAQSLK